MPFWNVKHGVCRLHRHSVELLSPVQVTESFAKYSVTIVAQCKYNVTIVAQYTFFKTTLKGQVSFLPVHFLSLLCIVFISSFNSVP